MLSRLVSMDYPFHRMFLLFLSTWFLSLSTLYVWWMEGLRFKTEGLWLIMLSALLALLAFISNMMCLRLCAGNRQIAGTIVCVLAAPFVVYTFIFDQIFMFSAIAQSGWSVPIGLGMVLVTMMLPLAFGLYVAHGDFKASSRW